MSVTITFEKKHFLMTGIIIAFPFIILAISNIFAATTMPIVGHPISELFVDGNLDMNNNKITNLADPILDGDVATQGYVKNYIGAVSNNAFGNYTIFAKCTSCGQTYSDCTPSDESAQTCPVGYSEVFFAKHDTDFVPLDSIYNIQDVMVLDTSLVSGSCVYDHSNSCSANVIDLNNKVLASTSATKSYISKSTRCVRCWCSYRICQKN